MMYKIFIAILIVFLFQISCANINSLVGVYHERVELKSSIASIDSNAYKTLKHFSKSNIDTLDSKVFVFYVFAYGCSSNEKFINKLDSLSKIKNSVNFIYSCDNLSTKKRTYNIIKNINVNVANSLIYTKNGVKKSLHQLGIKKGFNSTLDQYPNNLYVVNKEGSIIFACYSPTKKHIDSLNKIL